MQVSGPGPLSLRESRGTLTDIVVSQPAMREIFVLSVSGCVSERASQCVRGHKVANPRLNHTRGGEARTYHRKDPRGPPARPPQRRRGHAGVPRMSGPRATPSPRQSRSLRNTVPQQSTVSQEATATPRRTVSPVNTRSPVNTVSPVNTGSPTDTAHTRFTAHTRVTVPAMRHM